MAFSLTLRRPTKTLLIVFSLIYGPILSLFTPLSAQTVPKKRVIVSTDIGGTDPDDFQSMIHLMMYSDLFELEGLISSPFGEGTTKDILKMIDLYEQDRPQLARHIKGLAAPEYLRKITKQGAKKEAPFQGYTKATEGSEWIISCARKKTDQPLWVLVWGGIEDIAQALHDAPEIEKNIRVYWIGGPNKKWSVNAYAYLAEHHPNLYMIESNATYRGWFMEDENAPENMSGGAYYSNFIKGHGAMADNFVDHYKGHIKMGDTPSLAYLMQGNSDDPTSESWGGRYNPINRSSRYILKGNSANKDTVSAYGVIEWHFSGPVINIPPDSICFTLMVQNQEWPGYYLGNGQYSVRYSSKKPETGTYVTKSSINALNGLKGKYISTAPWPGKPAPHDYLLGPHWYSDLPDAEYFLEGQQGARTISKYRKEFLSDWARRWSYIKN
ncbi:nucleoside hydrolase-like domain-containing protein [Dyadobacter tibetensis]|uniref:nucleoside hydrolase-like domain-containing protein n=1 Tax=Dyadobacter tibetensis TaxID=1211851 RepID=UPI0004AE57BE|nr:nucleoside hydrolase-like domain-containing protein [Dyadobacter tibetensis]